MLEGWVSRSSPAQKFLLEEELNHATYVPDTGSKFFLAKFSWITNQMRAVGIVKTPEEMLEVILPRFFDEFAIQHAILRD